MTFFLVVVLILIFCFGFVVAFGAPYLPTLGKQQQQALELLGLKPGQTMLELPRTFVDGLLDPYTVIKI